MPEARKISIDVQAHMLFEEMVRACTGDKVAMESVNKIFAWMRDGILSTEILDVLNQQLANQPGSPKIFIDKTKFTRNYPEERQ